MRHTRHKRTVMPLRERIKRAFRSSSPNSDLHKTSSAKSGPSARDVRWPSNVYAPGEPMPRPKYRAPVKKEHKEKLEAFDFGSAWRRHSFISEYSPMGSRMPSRRNSFASRRSLGGNNSRRNSFGGTASRRGSLGDGAKDVDTTLQPKKSRHAARPTRLSAEIEAEGDDDVTNVGLSRVQSRDRDKVLSRQLSAADNPMPSHGQREAAIHASHPHNIDGVASDHHPFTEEELVLAMKKSHLNVPGQP